MHRYIYRSAITGKIVTAAYAKKNPKTTVRETVKTKTNDTKRVRK